MAEQLIRDFGGFRLPVLRPLDLTQTVFLGATGFMLLLGILQAAYVNSEFDAKCGYPFNVSFVVFFMLTQFPLLAAFARFRYIDILEGGFMERYVGFAWWLAPTSQFPLNFWSSWRMSDTCGGAEIPTSVNVLRYFCVILSGIFAILALFVLLMMKYLPNPDDEWF